MQGGNLRLGRRPALLGLAAMAAAAPRRARAGGKLVVYTVIPEAAVNDGINAEFTQRTGIAVDVLGVPAVGTLASRIRTEKDHPRGDIFAAAPIDFQDGLAKDGLLEAYRAPAETDAWIAKGYADPKGFWHGWYGMTTCTFWNTDRFKSDVASKGGTPPTVWDDLLKPVLKGQIVMSNPQTSAIGFVLLAIQIFRLGEDKAWDYVRALDANVAQYTPSAPMTVSLVEQGEAAVGAFWLADVLNAKLGRKQPMDFAVPPDNVVNIWAASIIKGGPNTDAAKAYIDFLLEVFPQDVNAQYGYRHPLNPAAKPPAGAPPLGDIKAVKYDNGWATANMDRLRKKWAQETGK
jgi:iron(III) transport system substrate-binding protein